MNKVFCVSCGSKILYELKKPKFCSSCGQSIGGVVASMNKEEVEETSNVNINLNKLKKDISVENVQGGTTIEQIWGSVTSSEARGSRESYNRPASKDPSGKELLDKTIKDCSSSRMRDIDE
tara:strand:+ start:143 stop:505 length:363 start_codon:yes stop_codon:yes gene_type:complete